MAQIDKPNLHFNTKLYTGTGNDNHGITGVGFQPDLTWIKERSSTSSHAWWDAVRGVTKKVESDNNQAEGTDATGLKSFDSDGFTTGTSPQINQSGVTNCAWNWKAAGAGSANTDGTINSTVSANTTSGFSIVSYTGNGTAGATIGHGLGIAPKVVLVKRRSQAGQWVMGHDSLGFTKFLELDLTGAAQTSTVRFNDTAPTSSVFTVGSTADTNQNGTTIIAYCFAEIPGYSKFGSYTGNGSTNGTFVYTGFKPAFIIYKGAVGANAADNWEMVDNKRSTYNGVENVLYPNLNNAEGTGVTTRMDLLSNGFKMRTSGTDYNGSGQTYIYMAFAENPLVGTNNIPATAR